MLNAMLSPRHRGMSLLEVLVALTVLSVSIVGITSAISSSSRTATGSIRTQDALRIAKNELAQIIAEAEANPASKKGKHEQFSWERTFEQKEHRLILASVRVVWLDGGIERDLTLSELYLPREVMDGEDES